MKLLLYFLLILACGSCSSPKNEKEKRQKQRTKIVDVQDAVKGIKMEDVLIGSLAQPYIYDDYLLVADYRSSEKLIHAFDKHSFKYLTSFGDIGQGLKEISSLGTIAWNDNNGARIFHVFDITGDYLKTLNVGQRINYFCYDEENKRIIMNLDSEYQFACLDMEELFND